MANPEGSQDWEGIDTVESDAQILTRVEPLVASSEKIAGNDLWMTHAGVTHVLVCHLLRINRDGFDRFYFPNGSVTTLQKTRGTWRLVELWLPRQRGDENADRRLPA
jgi:broad specificity phosphatase PhoE